MPAPKPISREYRIYLALWRKAAKSDEIVKIKCSTWQMAISMRQGMYRAIRPFRLGHMADEELRVAAENFVVYLAKVWAKKGEHDKLAPHYLELRARVTLAELDGMLEDLGIEDEDLLLGDERQAVNKLQQFLETTPEAKQTKTPFYTRDN